MIDHRLRAGVVCSECEWDVVGKAVQEIAQMTRAGVDVLPRIEGIADAEHRGRPRHELHQPPGSTVGDRARVELGFDRDHGRHERFGDTVAHRGTAHVRGDGSRRFTRGQPADLGDGRTRRWQRLGGRHSDDRRDGWALHVGGAACGVCEAANRKRDADPHDVVSHRGAGEQRECHTRGRCASSIAARSCAPA